MCDWQWYERGDISCPPTNLSTLIAESIDELTKLVVPLYSCISNRGLDPRPVFEGPVWGNEQKGVSEPHTATDVLLISIM